MLGDKNLSGACCRIDGEQLQRLLVAALALDVEGLAVLRPVDAGEVDVGVGPKVDLDRRAAGQALDVELDNRVGATGSGIALADDGRAFRADIDARDDVDLAFVDLCIGDGVVLGAPPITGVAAHLFLSHELGGSERDRIVCGGGDRFRRALRQRRGVEHAIADEAEIAARGRDLGVGGVAALRSPRDALGDRAGLRVGDVELPRHRDDDAGALIVPGVFDHAMLADALAFAAGEFGFAERRALHLQRGGVDQPLWRARSVRRNGPEVEGCLVFCLGLQIGDELAVRRQGDTPRHRSGQVPIGEHALWPIGGGGGARQGRKREEKPRA